MRSLRSLRRLALLVPLALTGCGDNTDSTGGDPDASPPEEPDAGDGGLPLERGHAGGSPTAIAFDGDHAYIAIGPRLTIWERSNPDAPTLVGEIAPLAGRLTDVAVADGYAYVVEHVDLDGHLYVVDVGTPSAPEVVATLRIQPAGTYTVPLGVAVAGDRLYVADQEHGIAVLDVTTPAAPEAVTTIERPGVTDVEAFDSRVYYVAASFFGGEVGVLDPAADHAVLGTVNMGDIIGAAVTEGGLVAGIGAAGLEVHDLSDPANPALRYRDENLQSRAVIAAGSTVWVPTEAGLYALDLSPQTPVLSSPVELATEQANDGAVAGDMLGIITDHGQLVTADISTPTAPTSGGVVDISLCADCIGIDVAGEVLAISDFFGGLRTGTIGDLGALGRGKPDAFVVFEDVDVAGDLAYVADWNFGLRIFDISDPTQPREVGAVATGGYPSSVRYADGYAYVGESTNGGAFKVVDVRDPASPQLVTSLTTTKALDVEIVGRLAYVADQSFGDPGGLRILDISTPSAPTLVGQYTGCSEVNDVAVAGEVALLACSFDGFHVVDVSEPARPAQLAVWAPPSPNAAEAVALDGARAYLGHSTAVVVADLSTPSTPAIGDEYAIAWTVRGLAVAAPGRVVASCGPAGVYQWQVDRD